LLEKVWLKPSFSHSCCFKLNIFESERKIFKNRPIDLIEKKIKCFQGLKIISEEQDGAIFIIAEGRESLIGGARLVRTKLKNIQEDVRELVTTLPLEGYVWECSSVFFEVTAEYSASGEPETEYFYQSFYRGLYDGFVEFGKMKGVGFLIMKLASEAYVSTKEFGMWPYVVELKPDNSPDGLFHGILPLTGSQYTAYQKSCEVLDKHLNAYPKQHI